MTEPTPPASAPSNPLSGDNAGLGGAWLFGRAPEPEQGEAFVALAASLRRLQDRAAGCRPPAEASRRAATLIGEAADLLAEYAVAEEEQLAAKIFDVPGRAQTMAPVMTYDHLGQGRIELRATFTRFHLGGHMAAHGGTLALVFDEALGALAGAEREAPSRTAYLHINYRKITPLDRELRVVGQIDRVEGRKIYASARMEDGADLLADAEGLFVTLLPGQP